MTYYCNNCGEHKDYCECDNPNFDDDGYKSNDNQPNRQVRATQDDRVNWLGDPWAYVPGDPYY